MRGLGAVRSGKALQMRGRGAVVELSAARFYGFCRPCRCEIEAPSSASPSHAKAL